MKKLILLACVAFSFGPAFAQDPATNQPAAATTLHPEWVQFKEIEYDFGNVKQNEPPSHTFTFKNVGDKDINLVNVQASCGCTTPNWKGGIYKPGETGDIIATYNAANEGSFNKVITVTTSEGVVILTIKGNVMNATAYDNWKAAKDKEDAEKAKNEQPAKSQGKAKGKEKSKENKGKSKENKGKEKSDAKKSSTSAIRKD